MVAPPFWWHADHATQNVRNNDEVLQQDKVVHTRKATFTLCATDWFSFLFMSGNMTSNVSGTVHADPSQALITIGVVVAVFVMFAIMLYVVTIISDKQRS